MKGNIQRLEFQHYLPSEIIIDLYRSTYPLGQQGQFIINVHTVVVVVQILFIPHCGATIYL